MLRTEFDPQRVEIFTLCQVVMKDRTGTALHCTVLNSAAESQMLEAAPQHQPEFK